MRADSLADALDGQLPLTARREGLTITITEFSQDGNAVTVEGSISRDGVELPISWPCIVVNPPLLVEDPQGDVERTFEDAATGEVTTLRFRVDPLECLLSTLVGVAS